MNSFQKKRCCGILFLTLCIMAQGVISFASYRTPDSGTTYTLASLVPLSGGTVLETSTGYILDDELTIAPTDALEINDEFLYFNPWDMIDTPDINPCLVIEGRLKASDSHFLPSEPMGKEDAEGEYYGIVADGSGAHGKGEADVTSCTFQMLHCALTARSGKVSVEKSRFEDCKSGGVFLYQKSEGAVADCMFHESEISIDDSEISMLNCQLKRSNMSINNVSNESLIKDCVMNGSNWAALHVSGDSGARIQDNVFKQCDYGISIYDEISSSTANIEGNIISGCRMGAATIEGTAEPRFRKNRILYNATNPPVYTNPVILPAILVFQNAKPDFGAPADWGENIIRYNSPVAFYHAGETDIQAVGNDWGISEPSQPEKNIYHKPDDYEDADESGYLSGIVEYAPVAYLRLYSGSGNFLMMR